MKSQAIFCVGDMRDCTLLGPEVDSPSRRGGGWGAGRGCAPAGSERAGAGAHTLGRFGAESSGWSISHKLPMTQTMNSPSTERLK